MRRLYSVRDPKMTVPWFVDDSSTTEPGRVVTLICLTYRPNFAPEELVELEDVLDLAKGRLGMERAGAPGHVIYEATQGKTFAYVELRTL